jgi:hypothetical protein
LPSRSSKGADDLEGKNAHLTLRTPVTLLTLSLADLDMELRDLKSKEQSASEALAQKSSVKTDPDLQADLAAAHDLDEEALDEEALDVEVVGDIDLFNEIEAGGEMIEDSIEEGVEAAVSGEPEDADPKDAEPEQDEAPALDNPGAGAAEKNHSQDQIKNQGQDQSQDEGDLEPIVLLPRRPEPQPDLVILNLAENILAHLLWRGLGRARHRALKLVR